MAEYHFGWATVDGGPDESGSGKGIRVGTPDPLGPRARSSTNNGMTVIIG